MCISPSTILMLPFSFSQPWDWLLILKTRWSSVWEVTLRAKEWRQMACAASDSLRPRQSSSLMTGLMSCWASWQRIWCFLPVTSLIPTRLRQLMSESCCSFITRQLVTACWESPSLVRNSVTLALCLLVHSIWQASVPTFSAICLPSVSAMQYFSIPSLLSRACPSSCAVGRFLEMKTRPVVGLSSLWEMQIMSFLKRLAIRENRLRLGSASPWTEQPASLLRTVMFWLSKTVISPTFCSTFCGSIWMYSAFFFPISCCSISFPRRTISLSPSAIRWLFSKTASPPAVSTKMSPARRYFCAEIHPTAVFLRYRSSRCPTSQCSRGKGSQWSSCGFLELKSGRERGSSLGNPNFGIIIIIVVQKTRPFHRLLT